jgi:cytochrome P450
VRLGRDTSRSLLFGAGIHVCPGAPLARLELRVALEELLARTAWFELDSAEGACRRAVYPANGFAELRLRLSR